MSSAAASPSYDVRVSADERAHLLDEARRARAEAEAATARAERLLQVTVALAAADTPAAVDAAIMQHAVLAAGAYAGCVALRTADRTALELRTSVGYPPAACMTQGKRWPASAAIPIAEAARTGEPVYVESLAAWAARYGGGYTPGATPPAAPAAPAAPPPPPLAAAGARSAGTPPPSVSRAWAALPLMFDGVPAGALLWTFDAPREFPPAERAYMEQVARQCEQALDRAALREAERRARAQAEAANRAKSDFLAKMSHELRTPLNAIGGHAELIAMGVHGPVTPAQADALARLRRSQQHLLSLIHDLLDFSTLEAGRLAVARAPVNVRDVVLAIEAIVGPSYERAGVALEVRCGEQALLARGDVDRITQIGVNLASNALKATPAGGRVLLRCAPHGANVVLDVVDTGHGIAPEEQGVIFSPFTQLGRALNNPGGGVGLGLAISRELARAMGGDVSVTSAPGAGATFTLTLPRS